ncbi:MAG: hypothetical protein IGS48_03200 [Oscillatoriales cyanobacterium C42_A2020_001]|nr:hypothetical protein [Leptolyngbyaceae cyanobacterium C42_A2020_001]
MQPPVYCHTIRFRGSTHPQGRYQLQISEIGNNGQPQYRAQWDFPTLKNLTAFLKKYFPNSQALAPTGTQELAFEKVLAIAGF